MHTALSFLAWNARIGINHDYTNIGWYDGYIFEYISWL